MASAVPYTITPEPASSAYNSLSYQPVYKTLPPTITGQMPIYQQGSSVVTAPIFTSAQTPAGGALTQSMDASIYQPQQQQPQILTHQPQYLMNQASSQNQPTTGSGYQAEAGSLSMAYKMTQQHSQSNNMPVELATTTSKIAGVVPTGLYTSYIPASHLNSRVPSGGYNNNAQGAAGAPKQPVTVYYTDDLYPPYYAKAKKVSSTKKRTGCCA